MTLALIFVEDERVDEVDERVGSLVLFYVGGIVAMTLIINGSLAGHLVHYLRLDRWGMYTASMYCCVYLCCMHACAIIHTQT